MIRGLAIGLAALAAAPACLAEGGPIRSGEQPGFSRIVMEIDPTTEWSLEVTSGAAAIFFPRKALEFGTGAVFDKIPRTRILAVESRIDPSGTTVAVTLGCDCRVSTAFVGARYLALDISDRGATPTALAASEPEIAPEPVPEPPAEPEAETAAARVVRERVAVNSAEEILIRQIERAAGQGLIELAGTEPDAQVSVGPASVPPDPGTPDPDTPERVAEAAPEVAPRATPEPPRPPARPVASPPPVVPLSLGPSEPVQLGALTELLDSDQVLATTVFDRDRAAIARAADEPEVPAACRPDEEFALGHWADARPPYQQIVERAGRLVGEFDTPDPDVLLALARLHIRFGLGTEAEQILAAFPADLDSRALLVDLARAVEGREPLPGGPLSLTDPCPGAHGLWLAIGGAAPAFHDPEHFEGAAVAFGELPPDLRVLVGPALIGRLLDAGQPDAARRIYEITTRPEPGRSAALSLGEARLVAAEGNPAAAVQALGELVETNAPNAPDALVHLARLAIDAGLILPDRLVADLGTAARLYRPTAQGPEFRALLAEALASRGEIAAAMQEIRAGLMEWPQDPRFAGLVIALLAAADPEQGSAAAYAETILANQSLIPDAAATDPVRRGIALNLLDLGLAQAARDLIAPAVGRGDTAARLIDAEAAVALGATDDARAVLAGLEGPDAATLRARAFSRDGAFDVAVATLVEAGIDPEAGGYDLPSGDWLRTRADAGDDTARAALDDYIEARARPAAATPQAPDPAPPAEAADDPRAGSLAAARRLLASGREVEDFVAELLRNP